MSSSTSPSASASSRSTPASSQPSKPQYCDQLIQYCQSNGYRDPTWQVLSDKRGARTAWSAVVIIQEQTFPARFWYDGDYVDNAREDAAQVALQRLGEIPPSGRQPAHLQELQQGKPGESQQRQLPFRYPPRLQQQEQPEPSQQRQPTFRNTSREEDKPPQRYYSPN